MLVLCLNSPMVQQWRPPVGMSVGRPPLTRLRMLLTEELNPRLGIRFPEVVDPPIRLNSLPTFPPPRVETTTIG